MKILEMKNATACLGDDKIQRGTRGPGTVHRFGLAPGPDGRIDSQADLAEDAGYALLFSRLDIGQGASGSKNLANRSGRTAFHSVLRHRVYYRLNDLRICSGLVEEELLAADKRGFPRKNRVHGSPEKPLTIRLHSTFDF